MENKLHKEKLPPNNSFKVKVENPDLIYKAVRSNTGIYGSELGEASLTDPFKSISVTSKSDNNHFSLHTNLFFNPNRYEQYSKQFCNPFISKIIEDIRKLNPEMEISEFNDAFNITTSNGSTFGIKIEHTCGPNTSVYIDSKNTLENQDITDEKNFKVVLEDYAKTNEMVVNGIYSALNLPKPNNTLSLRPPLIRSGKDNNEGPIFGQNNSSEKIENLLNFEKPNTTFADVGGQENAKKEIESLSFAIKNPELYKKWGTKPPKGILLYGPPGTGKTLMAKALAHESDAEFINLNASDIVSKWYGESEKTIANIFKYCQNLKEKKFLIFIDEIESIAMKRDYSHEASARIVSTFLSNLDGMISTDNITIIGCTNRLGAIDEAFIRSGRLDRLIEVPLPDTIGRREIFNIMVAKANKIAEKELFNNIDWDVIVSETNQTSGADIAEIIRRTLEEKVRMENMGNKTELVSTEDILMQIKAYEKIITAKKSIGFESTK